MYYYNVIDSSIYECGYPDTSEPSTVFLIANVNNEIQI